ncbi:uncharacterized protein LOC127729997 isoform X2 [Mytilus californianus]|uniref:uncharacterized protein LOC127729997 isoform X2 n=1 Tax=Mytilus californianus TaxID=6549 RepID=UPI002246538D|nr:uncharacterized protein LOC127729997 isoform X2 [Mytilus californianus]
MEKRKHKGLVGVVLFFSLLAFIAHGVAFGLPYWYRQSLSSSINLYGGLWQICAEISGTFTCTEMTPWDSDLSWYQRTCQGLAIGASLLTLIGIIILIVKQCKGSEPGWKRAYPVSRVLFFVGGTMIEGVTTVWATCQEDIIKENKSFAYWVECGAGVLFIVSAILLAIRMYAPSDPYRTPTAQSYPNTTPTAQAYPYMTPPAQAYPYMSNQRLAKY